jgi:hypothetical protein
VDVDELDAGDVAVVEVAEEVEVVDLVEMLDEVVVLDEAGVLLHPALAVTSAANAIAGRKCLISQLGESPSAS